MRNFLDHKFKWADYKHIFFQEGKIMLLAYNNVEHTSWYIINPIIGYDTKDRDVTHLVYYSHI